MVMDNLCKKNVNKAAMPGLNPKSKAIKKEEKENLTRDLFNAKQRETKKTDTFSKKAAYYKKEERRREREQAPLKVRDERKSKYNAKCDMKNKFVNKEKIISGS